MIHTAPLRGTGGIIIRARQPYSIKSPGDLYEAWMTTQLADGNTRFLPFNQGTNGAGNTGGAGNPANPNGYATSYLWEEVLQRDSLLDLIHRFISFVKEKEEVVKNGVSKTVTKEKMIFPRYHQYDVVKKAVNNIKTKKPKTKNKKTNKLLNL